MNGEIIAIIILLLILGGVSYYLLGSKGSRQCIGCPNSRTCNIKKFQKSIKDAHESFCDCRKIK